VNAEVIQLRRHDLIEGDVVRLKSGGPLMLVGVADPEIEDRVMCLWMGGARNRRLQSGMFSARVLDVVARGGQA
jgi:uncharacterized protein YodC (DUF2158 family)